MPTLNAGDSPITITVPEGQALSITGAPNTAGVVYRLNEALGGTNSDASWAVGAGALAAIGPNAGARRYLVTCSAGSIAAAVGDAVVNVPQIVVSAASPNNADGRPDGTVYIQSAS